MQYTLVLLYLCDFRIIFWTEHVNIYPLWGLFLKLLQYLIGAVGGGQVVHIGGGGGGGHVQDTTVDDYQKKI